MVTEKKDSRLHPTCDLWVIMSEGPYTPGNSEVTQINDAKKQIFPVHTLRKANMRMKFAVCEDLKTFGIQQTLLNHLKLIT